MVLPRENPATSSCCAETGPATTRIEIVSAARGSRAACGANKPHAPRARLIAFPLSKTVLDRPTNDRVTFAHNFFQLFAVQYLDHGAAIIDCLSIPQRSRRRRHARRGARP